MKSTIYTVLFTALVLCVISGNVSAQAPKDSFTFDVLNFYSTEGTGSRVDVYVEIPLGNFEFKKSKDDDSKYISKLDLTIDVKEVPGGKSAYSAVTKEELTTKIANSEYLNLNSQIVAKNLFLNPGKYKMKITIYELSTKRRYEMEKEFEVRDFTLNAFSISDIMIVSKINMINGKKFITPDVARNVGALDTFNIFFFIYKNTTVKDISLNIKIFDSEKKEIAAFFENMEEVKTQMQNQYIYAIPTNNMSYGQYTVEVTASNSDYSTVGTSKIENINTDFPYSLKDIDKLIDQLVYIAKSSEMDNMRDGKTDSEKQKRFLEFWKSKDPTPGTKRNELMIEYYRRLTFANAHFNNTYSEGWKTDMGMVYILFGMPSNIERHPYEMDTKPYEIWEYDNITRQFIFVDNSGFGDYRLITPIGDSYKFQFRY